MNKLEIFLTKNVQYIFFFDIFFDLIPFGKDKNKEMKLYVALFQAFDSGASYVPLALYFIYNQMIKKKEQIAKKVQKKHMRADSHLHPVIYLTVRFNLATVLITL